MKLETVDMILETPQKKEVITESFEQGLNCAFKNYYFKENPTQIFKLLPLVHFLRCCDQPHPISKVIRERKMAEYWGFHKISISVLNAFKTQETQKWGHWNVLKR